MRREQQRQQRTLAGVKKKNRRLMHEGLIPAVGKGENWGEEIE
jgi:hypothetical protein